MIHELKTWTEFYKEVFYSHKLFEVRFNDRDFKVGDMLNLKEYDPIKERYTGRQLTRTVTYILHGGKFGIQEGYCVMAIQ